VLAHDSAAVPTPWQTVERLLPAGWEQQAKELRFCSVAPDAPGAVGVPPAAKLQAMLHLVAANLSLRTNASFFAAADIVAVSHVAMHKWFRGAVPFFSYLLHSLTGAQRLFAQERWAGYQVRAIDATTVQRPGAKGTTARIHYCLRLDEMTCDQCIVTDEKVGESLRNFITAEGVLDIVDRGYSNPPSVATAVDQGGDVLVRWNPLSLPLYDSRGRRIDPTALLRGLNFGQVTEWSAEVRPRDHDPIPVRLVVTRLPADQADKARARVRREQDKPNDQILHWAGYVMLVTTVPKSRLDAVAIAELYRLRWQIELQFKRDKSIGGLDLLPNRRDENVKSWILAKLLLSQLARRLVAPDASSSKSKTPNKSSVIEDEPPAAAHLWESATLAWLLLRSAFLSIDWSDLGNFVRRFRAHLARLKRKDDPLQVAAFLEFLGGQNAARSPG
jgi:hypothetical protein